MVLAAKDKASPDSAAALEALCRTYWYPLYAFVRRQGHTACDAQDLTQGFFARLLEKDYLAAAAREKGRFRTFLLVALKRFLANEWDHARRLKRGGGHTHFSLETEMGEERYQAEGGDGLPPDRLYERRWAMTLLEQALARLRAEHAAAGKTTEFEKLKGVLMADRGAIDYCALAAALGLERGGGAGSRAPAAKAVSRAVPGGRRRYGFRAGGSRRRTALPGGRPGRNLKRANPCNNLRQTLNYRVMNDNFTCPKCGQPVPPDAPEGLCPRCVGALNLDSATGISGSGRRRRRRHPQPRNWRPTSRSLRSWNSSARAAWGWSIRSARSNWTASRP